MGFDITTNKTAVCLAIALKTGSVLPGTGSTAISTDHISTSGSDRAPGAPTRLLWRPSGWGRAVGRYFGSRTQASGTRTAHCLSAGRCRESQYIRYLAQLSNGFRVNSPICPFCGQFASDFGDFRAIWALRASSGHRLPAAHIAASRWAGRQSIGPLNSTDMRFNGHLGLFLLALAADLLTLARGKNRPKF